MDLETKRKKTKICCLDLDTDCLNLLNKRFDVYDGSLGKPIDVSGKNYRGLNLLLNYELPRNIHEYEIFIEDMIKSDKIPYNKEENTRTEVFGSEEYYFVSTPPQTVFDPCPFGSSILNEKIHQFRTRPAIRIAFQAPFQSLEYFFKNIADHYSGQSVVHNNYEHLGEFCLSSIAGLEVKLCDNDLSRTLFESFLDDVSYCQVYEHPTKFDNNRTRVKDDKFIPLLINKSSGIVSYLWLDENDIVLVLPQTKKKCELLQKVMHDFLFNLNSATLFPKNKLKH